MPTITISKKELEKLIGKKLKIEELKNRISYLGTDLEKIEGDEIIVEVFPNRPDMLSLQGFARALSSFISVKKGLRKYNVKNSKEEVIIEQSVKKVRPYTACAVVKSIKFDNEKIKEIVQIQEKLHVTYGRNRRKVAIGIYPYEKIKTPIKYLAMEPEKIKFRPLEYPSVLNGIQILSKHSAGREYGHLLEKCKKYPVFIDVNNSILSMPPIINSHDTGKITGKTRDVFIECSGFDFNVLKKCLNIIVTALADMGGQIYSMKLKYRNKSFVTPDLKPEKMNLNLKYVNKILGLNLNKTDIKKYLEKMGYGFEKGKVLVPSYRTDILHEIDLIEDIAIAHGYENFKEEIPEVATIAEEDKFEVFKRKVSEILLGLGLTECNTYNLIDKDSLNKKMNVNLDCVELSNASSKDYSCLRSWMIPSLMNVLSNNKMYDYPQNIFEIGSVFKKDDKQETGVKEFSRTAVLLCGKDANYTKIRQILDALLNSLGLNYTIKEVKHDSFIDGRVARISVNGKDVAYIGEISPVVLSNFGLEMPVAALELNLSEIYKNI
jgi:phenylalanyl-tRNA synthetase beta chain